MDDLIVPAGQRSYSFYGFELWGTPWFFHNLESDGDNGEGAALRGESPLVAGALVGGEKPHGVRLASRTRHTDRPVGREDGYRGGSRPCPARRAASVPWTNCSTCFRPGDNQGLRPLHVAARFSESGPVIVALAEAGANVHALTVHDYNALHRRRPDTAAARRSSLRSSAVGVDLKAPRHVGCLAAARRRQQQRHPRRRQSAHRCRRQHRSAGPARPDTVAPCLRPLLTGLRKSSRILLAAGGQREGPGLAGENAVGPRELGESQRRLPDATPVPTTPHAPTHPTTPCIPLSKPVDLLVRLGGTQR